MAKVIKGIFPEAAKKTSPKEDKSVPSYVLHISITFSDPLIWRRIQVPGIFTLAQLHDVIQAAMGWSDSHVHQFLVGKISYEPTMKSNRPRESKRFDEDRYQLYTLEEGMQFMFSYIYDAGEGWEHVIQLEESVSPEKELKHPILLAGQGNCPPEEIGDVHQYNQLITGFENDDVQAKQTLDELSGSNGFDPSAFDFDNFKKRVSQLVKA